MIPNLEERLMEMEVADVYLKPDDFERVARRVGIVTGPATNKFRLSVYGGYMNVWKLRSGLIAS